MNLAIIPARGGSKRIPRKNIKSFVGQPLISYSLNAAVESKLFDAIIVSTDDAEIGKIALEFGATNILDRPPELSGDMVSSGVVVRHAIEEYKAASNKSIDYVCCIYATAPFISCQDIKTGFRQLIQTPEAHYAFSVTTFAFPIQRALRLSGGGVEPLLPDSMKKRSQDLEERYHDAGQFYWGRCKSWVNQVSLFRPHSLPVVLPRFRVQDIDTEEDWQQAELMYRAYCEMQSEQSLDDRAVPAV